MTGTLISRVVSAQYSGLRQDRYLTAVLSDTTRSQLHRWIADGAVRVNGVVRKPAYAVRAGDVVEVLPPTPRPLDVIPEAVPLDILYEDPHLIVINKRAGMVVHPGAGRSRGTLVNALLAHCQDLQGIGDRTRPGIVHRLDKGTSGVMVVAKSARAHEQLVRQFQARTVEKIYSAAVVGKIPAEGTIAAAVGRHPHDRKKMSTHARRGRAAVTHWRVAEYFGAAAAWVEVRLATGRTHQIRVHFAAKGHPLIGDAVYGGVRGLRRLPSAWQAALADFGRPALHAWRLQFTHPVTGERAQFEAPIPPDLEWLRRTCRRLGGSG